MKPSSACIALIKRFEGFRSKPYLCPAGVPTIGYGSTRYPDGRAVTMKDAPITESQANEILMATLQGYADAVSKLVRVQLTQGQFDALVDFAYNLGAAKLAGSTLLGKVNSGDLMAASKEFGKWVFGGGSKLPGLVDRREAERKLFIGEA